MFRQSQMLGEAYRAPQKMSRLRRLNCTAPVACVMVCIGNTCLPVESWIHAPSLRISVPNLIILSTYCVFVLCVCSCAQGDLVFDGNAVFSRNFAHTPDSTDTARGGAIYNARIGTITFNGRLTANQNRANASDTSRRTSIMAYVGQITIYLLYQQIKLIFNPSRRTLCACYCISRIYFII